MGFADRERRISACAHHQFRLQSVSKLLTAAAMARLVERGALTLDAPVRTYIPDLPHVLGAVTPRQLASHRAGVRNYRDDNEALNTTNYPTATASLEKFRDDPLLFPPDSGSDFPAIIAEEIARPLDLSRTEAERAGGTGRDRVTFYDNVTPYSLDGRIVMSPALDFSSKWAGGGLLSTPEELVRFGTAHIPPFNQGFLRDETLEVLFTPRTRQFAVFGQGLGWVTARDHRLRRVRLHFGAGSGGTSFLAVYPDYQTSIAVVANLGHARFPIRRLIAATGPFVGDRYAAAAWVAGLASLVATIILLTRRRAGARA
jgi:serine beta-lactamase-like protein LACTB, mitochondrial